MASPTDAPDDATDEVTDPSPPASRRPRGVLLEVAYRGTRYSGFAAQRDVPTIEGELSRALQAIDPTASSLRFASRTDAGVHADGNLVAFDAELALPPRGWLQTLNRELPDDIAVRRVRSMPPGFNPRFASRSKRYRYSILLDKVRDPALADRAWRVGYEVRLDVLEAECGAVLGTHDFAAFRGAGDARENTVRTLTRVELVRTPDPRLVQLVVEGSAFLYNMVRIVAGSLVDVGRAHLARGGLARALVTKDRRDLGQTAPAHGLCLEHVDYTLPADVPTATSERDITPWPS